MNKIKLFNRILTLFQHCYQLIYLHNCLEIPQEANQNNKEIKKQQQKPILRDTAKSVCDEQKTQFKIDLEIKRVTIFSSLGLRQTELAAGSVSTVTVVVALRFISDPSAPTKSEAKFANCIQQFQKKNNKILIKEMVIDFYFKL